MTKSTITRERAQQIFLGNGPEPSASEERELARMALAAMDSESECLPLDYLQGHKDGLEWASQLAEANHPETGDWIYDDPIELAKAIRKGPDMPPAQPVADSEPVAIIDQANLDYLRSGADADVWPPEREEMGDVLLYRHPQPAPVVPGKWIPVSEKMPEVEGHYLVWANASRLDGYCDHLAIATYQGREWNNEFNWLVTHWIPLPAAPQEVKGE